MNFVDLDHYLKNQKLPEAIHYSEGLRLRPNYLIYSLGQKLNEEQKSFLNSKEIPWAEYSSCSAVEAVVAFLKSVNGGIYMPKLNQDLLKIELQQCVFLLDPHLIGEFETLLTKKRRGVLIKRPVVASHDFQEAIYLEQIC